MPNNCYGNHHGACSSAATALQNTAVSCNGGEDGAATVSVTGGNIPYSYLWDNGEINATATGLNAGLHAVDKRTTKDAQQLLR